MPADLSQQQRQVLIDELRHIEAQQAQLRSAADKGKAICIHPRKAGISDAGGPRCI